MTWFLVASAAAHIPVIYTTGPDDDWCQVIADALGGDYILLLPGDYDEACTIEGKVSDPEGEVTIVQSFDATDPARLVHDGSSDHLLAVSGTVVTLLQLSFGEVPEGVAAVRLGEGTDLTVRYNQFAGGEGAGVVQHGDIDGLVVSDNRFDGPSGPAVDLGCDGACATGSLTLDGNLVLGGSGALVASTADEALVVDNSIFDHEGVALQLSLPEGVIEANLVDGSADIEAAEVVNTVITGELTGSVDLLRFNTLLGAVSATAAEARANATVATDLGGDNVQCGADCFVDLEQLDLYPSVDSLLRAAATFDEQVRLDWCGNERRTPSSAGAVEAVGVTGFGPIQADYKALQDCRVSDPTGTVPTIPSTGDTADTGGGSTTAVDDADAGGCGCSTGGSALSGGAWLGLLVGWRRRRTARTGGAVSRPVVG
jgi:hypothetical protein